MNFVESLIFGAQFVVSLLDEDNYTDCNKHNHCSCNCHNYNGEATGFAGGSCRIGNIYFFSENISVIKHRKRKCFARSYNLVELSHKLNRFWLIYQVSIKVSRSCIFEIKIKALPKGILQYIRNISIRIRQPVPSNCNYGRTINIFCYSFWRCSSFIDATLCSSDNTAASRTSTIRVPFIIGRNTR